MNVTNDYDSAGLCISQEDLFPGSYASCWSVTKLGGKYEDNRSYLIDPLLLELPNFNLTTAV